MPTITTTLTLNVLPCAACKMMFAITDDFEKARRKDHLVFFCPSGHQNWYPSESAEEQLRRENQSLKQQQARLEQEANEGWRAANVAESKLRDEVKVRKRIEKRIAAGVCPDCNRSFANMARHMASKHKLKCEA